MNKVQPFLKWCGGKSRLISQYQPYFPTEFNNYFEPFLGGGAVFFHLAPKSARISDLNPDLINAYRCVRDEVENLISLLQKHKVNHNLDYYKTVRESSYTSPTQKAAQFIYLNKTCFNGLHRVNKSGKFNVPMGSYKNPRICDAEGLRRVSQVLQNKDIVCEAMHYHSASYLAQPGDFVYFDPPYVPISNTSNFTAYTKESFKSGDPMAEQVVLKDIFADLAHKGVKVMLSNSYCDFVKDLYRDFSIHEITAARSINCDRTKRGAIKELLITSY
jgi:DNA adenine methylase